MNSKSKTGRGGSADGGSGGMGGDKPGGGGGKGDKHSSGGGPAAGSRRGKPKKGEEGYESDESTHDSSLVESIEPRDSTQYDHLTPIRSLGRRVIDSLNTIPPRFGRNLLIGVFAVLFIGMHMRYLFGSDEENIRGNPARHAHNLNFLRICTGTLNGSAGTFS